MPNGLTRTRSGSCATSSGTTPGAILLLLALRSEEAAQVREAVTLLADMERIGVVRRLPIGRFTQAETGLLAKSVLGGEISPSTVALLHAQSEGVPFITEELLRAYRTSGLINQVDGTWTASQSAERLVPSAVRTLIERRGAHLAPETRTALAQAAALGRRVSLRDLSALRGRLGEPDDPGTLAELLEPAVAAGLLGLETGTAADYTFLHEQVREQAVNVLPQARRREVHAAIVDLLTSDAEPPAELLASIAHHARAAGDAERAGRYSISAARAALASNAPEEALRLARLGLSTVSGAEARAHLLRVQDDALAALRQAAERLQGLAELEALAEALRDTSLAIGAIVRRAATWRSLDDLERAAETARAARRRAVEAGDRPMELAACVELGQSLLGSAIGDGFVPVMSEIDAPGAREAYERAVVLATELGDRALQAAVMRELGVVQMASVRTAIVEMMGSGRIPDDLMAFEPVAGPLTTATNLFREALAIFEELGDRRGAMVSIISLAYCTWGADGVLGSARHLEAIRRLNDTYSRLTTESERAAAEAELLYAIQIYGNTDGFPDLALNRGVLGHRAARAIGDPSLEFATAVGLVRTHLQLDDTAEATRWLDRAAATAAASPTPLRSRQLERWRGVVAARKGDAVALQAHLGRELALAAEHRRTAARCEALACLALESATLGRRQADASLLDAAERAVEELAALQPSLPGDPIWPIQGDAAMVDVLLARGDADAARARAREILRQVAGLQGHAVHPEVIGPVARALAGSEDAEDQATARAAAQNLVGIVAERIADPEIAARWLDSQAIRELVTIADGIEAARDVVGAGPLALFQQSLPRLPLDLSEEETGLMRLVMDGRTDDEISTQLGVPEAEVKRRLAIAFERMGAPSRSVATLYGFMAGIM